MNFVWEEWLNCRLKLLNLAIRSYGILSSCTYLLLVRLIIALKVMKVIGSSRKCRTKRIYFFPIVVNLFEGGI